MKKSILYAVSVILFAATVRLGGFGSGMWMNYVFLLGMAVFIFSMDKRGIQKISRVSDDLKRLTEALWEAKGQGARDNEAYLSLMESLHFTYPETESSWMRLQEAWKISEGMDCNVEDYIAESEILESCNYHVCAQVPGILTALGILGTFLGLVLGLRSFDFSNADQMTSSVEALVSGLNVAFYTSIYGVTLSVFYNMVFRKTTTELSQQLNQFYDAFRSVMVPLSQKEMAERLDSRQAENNHLMQGIKEMLDERLGERLGYQMAETLTPVFDRITQSLDSMMLDFHKEQADSLEKIVDAFVDRMGGALNAHVNALGDSVDSLSQAQKSMSIELQNLILQIVKTGKDTAQINSQAGEILEQLSSYVPLLEQTARDSAGIIENMTKWSEGIQEMTEVQSDMMQTMTAEQNEMLKNMAEHEESLAHTCTEINKNQQQLGESLVRFTKAAETLAEREQDPMQLDDIKEMFAECVITMEAIQKENAQNMERIQNTGVKEMLSGVSAQAKANAEENQAIQQMMTEELRKMAKTQEDIVFLNAKIANTLSALTGSGKIELPSKNVQVEENRMEEQIRKMNAWMEEQRNFQERLLALEEAKKQPFWVRWGKR